MQTLTCNARTRSGDGCQNPPYNDAGLRWCWIHLAQKTLDAIMHQSAPPKLPDTRPCTVLNHNLTKCWRWTARQENGHYVCYSHRGKEPSNGL